MENLNLVLAKNKNYRTEIDLGKIKIGRDFLIIAGPCSVESEEQIKNIALSVKKSGANMLRGGAYKMRTSPYSFQGLGEKGLYYLKKAGELADLPIITEVTDTRDVALISEYADVLQIGARNMQNFALLVEVGKNKKPVFLKRGLSATIEEWLNAAEYILKEGNPKVILCERGIRTVENYTRNTLDVSAIALLKKLTHLPVIADPSHAAGRIDIINPLCLSSIMAGCDGLMLEVHPSPLEALSDSKQQLDPYHFDSLIKKINLTLDFRKTLELGGV